MDSETRTATRTEEALPLDDYLVCVLTADRPLEPSSRHALAELEAVEVGRGKARRTLREGGRLRLEVPDPRLSTLHARFVRSRTGWAVEDLKSKNFVHHNGRQVERAELEDGDVLELGYTFFVFRSGQASSGPADLDASELAAAQPWLRSLSPSLSGALAQLEKAADSDVWVMIRGETGVGKEGLARAVHALSGRPGPLVAINCGALTPTLYPSELFGYRKGAFSGAQQDREGLVAASHRGTLFLDEVAELPAEAQTALLRVLQEREVLPVGATRAQPVDLRVVAATHQNLDALVARGRFRADLRARLGGFTARLPPLRERREDLGLLVSTLLARLAPGRPGLRLTRPAARALFARRWNGNVRELERSLAYGVALAEGDAIDLPPSDEPSFQEGDAPPASRPAAASALLEPAARPKPRPKARLSDDDLRRVERLKALLAEHAGNITKVAEAMGVGRPQLYKWFDRYELDYDQFR